MEENLLDQTRCISHEIRNQLSVCELYTKIIKKHLELECIENTAIDNALKSIEKSVKMINNSLLDLKLLNNFELKKCGYVSLIEQAISLSNVYGFDKNINIVTDLQNDCFVLVDENKFLACLVNIFKNAVEAIESDGYIKVLSEIVNNKLMIKFINNGKQIPLEKQNSIFKKGFTTKQTGCGLGLYICKENLQKMDADLKLNYSTEKMTEFEIILPVYIA